MLNKLTRNLENEIVSRASVSIENALRNDLINCYGYSKEVVSNMSEDEVYALMDQIEANEKGYDEYEEESRKEYPPCRKCGSKVELVSIDCESMYDAHYVECPKCNTMGCHRFMDYDEEDCY